MPAPLSEMSPLVLIVATAVSTLATARMTRLAVYDEFPPAAWLRRRYSEAVGDGPWKGLATCPFCFSPWVQLGSLLWAWVGGLNPETWSGGLWWLTHLWLSLAYLAAMVVVRDQPLEYDDEG